MLDLQNKLIVGRARLGALTREQSRLESTIKDIKSEYEEWLLVQKLVQEASQLTLESISIKINKIVTAALCAVLPEPYEFFLDFKILYGQLACELRLEREGKLYDMRAQNGDGVVDIVALALRAAVLCLDKRQLRRVLILDEPAGAVSVDFQPMVGKLIEYLSSALKIQIIMIAAHGSNLEFSTAETFCTNSL